MARRSIRNRDRIALLLLGTLAGIGYARWTNMPLGALGDILAPPLALGVGIGRLGCLMAGCCFGKVCPEDVAWVGIRFPPGSFAAVWQGRWEESLPVFPTQLLESVLCVGLALFLWRWRCDNARGVTGQKFLAFALGYAAVRFGLEFLRGDNPPIGPLTFSQWACTAVSLLAAITWAARRRHADGWGIAYPRVAERAPASPVII